MKQVCVQSLLAAVLLAVIAVPVAGSGAKAAERRNPDRTAQKPTVTAGITPTPWPCTGKSCASVVTEMPLVMDGLGAGAVSPTQIANVFPTPWPCNGKSCTSVAGEMPPALANVFPTPWQKKPGFVLS